MENIAENNKLIAEFMGYEIQKDPTERFFGRYKSPIGTWYKEIDLAFHHDWNWLMKVVEKIYQTYSYYDKYIDYNSSQFTSGKIELSTKIESVFVDCLEFIKWYNQNK